MEVRRLEVDAIRATAQISRGFFARLIFEFGVLGSFADLGLSHIEYLEHEERARRLIGPSDELMEQDEVIGIIPNIPRMKLEKSGIVEK